MNFFSNLLPLKFIVLSFIFLYNQSITNAQADTLEIGIRIQPPYVEIENGEYFGLNISLIETLGRNLDFHCLFIEFSSQEEMEKSLVNHEIDLIANPISPNALYLEEIDFTHPFLVSNLAVAAKAPQFTIIKKLFTSIFSLHFLSGIIIIGLIMLFFGFLTWRFESKANEHHFPNTINGLWEAFWWSAVTMTTVGYGDKTPKTIGGRIVAMTWMFTGLIIISGYTGVVASLLTTNQKQFEYKSLLDLAASDIILLNNNASEQTIKALGLPYRTVESTETGLTAIANDEADIFIHDQASLQQVWNSDKMFSDVTIFPSENAYQLYGFALYKQHPDFIKLNDALIKETLSINWKRRLREVQNSKW